jgi:EAL domain-containing protein (putative c-di-GMP-specific phosphodiesterase class I)/GGDEF domain-containing protein
MVPIHGDLPGLSARASLADVAAELCPVYGLDERARSALRASFRFAAGDRRQRGRNLLDLLLAADGDIATDIDVLGAFLEVFAALPEADFAEDWLTELGDSWKLLRRAGCAVDLPLRAARTLAEIGSRQLLTDRESLSALELEMVNALAAAGMCVAELLGRETRRGARAMAIDDVVDQGIGKVLGRQIESALAAVEHSRGHAETVGLLALRLRLDSSALSFDLVQRDAILDAAVERLREVLREADVLVRTELHGCAILLPALRSPAQVQLAARKVTQVLELPFVINGVVARAMFALGVVWAPDHGRRPDELIRCVELALETALRGEHATVMFDQQLLVEARYEADLEKEFLVALENGHLAVHLQPQVDLKTRRCVGAELLMRWRTRDGHDVPPWHIPEVAHRLGAGPQLTRWLVFSACRTLAELDAAGVDIDVSVNLMGRDLMDQELPMLVEQAINFWRVRPARLTVELIESAVLGDPVAGAAVMNRLIALGVSTSIDDFGIGYSSILYLRQLPLHELKIDRVFVDAMSRSREDKEIVATLIQLAHGLDLHVVAEGVEDEQTADLLRDMGCDYGQGYWIGKAMPASEMPAWMASWNRQAG